MHKVYTDTLSLQGRVHHRRKRRAGVWGCGRSHWELRHRRRSSWNSSITQRALRACSVRFPCKCGLAGQPALLGPADLDSSWFSAVGRFW